MSFLGDLADRISSQFSIGENTTTSLNTIVDGQQVKYGALGDFASQFDQSAERRYTGSGYLRRDPYNTDPKIYETLWQEPNATVLVKKRMFSSIAENYRPDFMDADEKLYFKAMRILMQNKCNQIAALEKLSKIEQVTAAVGNINDQLVPIIITLTDIANNGFGNGSNAFGLLGGSNPFTTQDGSSFIKTVDRLRVLYAYNQTSPYTSWITDSTNMYQSIFGTGTGTIEITNFTSISTTTTTDIKSPGRFSISIVDPYESMLITDYDIEVALSDATNLFYNNKAFQFGVTSANQIISEQQQQLNTIRSTRNASPISFKIDPNTLLGKRITVIIDRLGVEIPFTYDPLGIIPGLGGSGDSVKVTDDFLRGGNVAGYDGLDTGPGYTGFPWENNATSRSHGSSELQLFQSIITAIFNQLELLANSAGNFTANNKSYNYARRKLRFNFGGKLIIQPMDVVHVYMSSKSQFDNKIMAGLQQMFSGLGILQNFTNTLTSINNAADLLFNPSANVAVQAEKSMYVGPDFPNYLWALVRTQFVTEKEGTHVFGGVVESAIDNWSNGRFNIEVSGTDNSYYFKQGKVNFKPGVDAFNGLIFDPLTPFESNFDSISVNNVPATAKLLNENLDIISESASSSLVKYKQGSLAGEKATQGNYIQDQSINPATGRLTRVFYAPDGLVYKWKQGIGIFTRYGTDTANDPSLVGAPNIYNEPFAGLDVMNVLSLLITGTPYNFATYYKATANLFGFADDTQNNQSSSYSFIKSLRTSLAKNNTLWGNFIPFKNLVMNEPALARAAQAQFTITNKNSDLDTKLKKLNDLQRSLVGLGAVNALSEGLPKDISQSVASTITDLQGQVSNLTTDVNKTITDIQAAQKSFYSQLDTSASYDSNYAIDGKNNPSDSQARKLLRKKTNYLTRRMSYDVRANQDKNLFIVDDYYDVDYDIAAFNKSLSTSSIPLYSTEYTDVSTKISQVADLLNLEVFCDSQGHIRVRSPQYNRMPSSVFYRMIYLKHALGVQIFPQFLNDLFTDQLTSLRHKIEILEDQIRLDCAILGSYPNIDVDGDNTAVSFLTNSQVTHGMGGTFNFISSPSGTITDIKSLIKQANQEQANGSVGQSLSDYDRIVAAGTSTKELFGNSEKYVVLFQALQSQNQALLGQNVGPLSSGTSIFQNSVVQTLIDRIYSKSGQRIVSKDYLTQAGVNQPIEVDTGQTVDLFKVTDELATYMQDWQRSVKAFYHTVKNSAEYQSLDDDSATSNSLLNPGLFKNSYIPEVFEHMIEDESYDDYGPGSGTRFVIRRGQVRNIRIAENAPAYTAVEAHGTFEFFSETAGGGGPPGLNSFPNNGNQLTSAFAIDYDMWRNYGFKEPYPLNVPFLQDPNTQLGPYAAMVLSRNRHNILRGSITISGNEYMQPGEVVYLEDRNLLFYVTSVSHAINVGTGFTTSLELAYGHSIGEYIPTTMDFIGKLIYKNQATTDTVIYRQDSSAQEESLGAVQIDGRNPSVPVVSSGSENSNVSSFNTSNQTVINNILFNTAYAINSNSTAGNNVKASIELRLYYDKSAGGVDFQLSSQAELVKKALTDQDQGPASSATSNQPVQNNRLPKDSVEIVTVNLDDESDRRSPSQKAIDAARNQTSNVSVNLGSPSPSNPIGNDDGTDAAAISAGNKALRTALFSYIIDCWITFTTVPATEANSSNNAGGSTAPTSTNIS